LLQAPSRCEVADIDGEEAGGVEELSDGSLGRGIVA
jgi:hypothetical protein